MGFGQGGAQGAPFLRGLDQAFPPNNCGIRWTKKRGGGGGGEHHGPELQNFEGLWGSSPPPPPREGLGAAHQRWGNLGLGSGFVFDIFPAPGQTVGGGETPKAPGAVFFLPFLAEKNKKRGGGVGSSMARSGQRGRKKKGVLGGGGGPMFGFPLFFFGFLGGAGACPQNKTISHPAGLDKNFKPGTRPKNKRG